MHTARTIAELRHALEPHRRAGERVGFIPTMGALHEGHLSLVRQARTDNQLVVASIFVNPTQFGPQEDLTRYPRTPERDVAQLEENGVDILFMPSADEIYPPSFTTRIEVGRLGEVLEGRSRPGHFSGVATVVAKLFALVAPTRAYFGQKDAQQLAVIRQIVRDLNVSIEIVAVPTVREEDGLAMSSRNAYLSPPERVAAIVLYRALMSAAGRFAQGERGGDALRHIMRETVEQEPLASLDYADVVDPATMETLDTVDIGALLVIAARVGNTRLIDNLPL